MKKLLFLAAVVMAAGACSRTYDVNPAADKAIDFGTWAENLTKGRTPGTSSFVSSDDFAVYGYKLTGSSKTVIFKKETEAGKENYNVVSTTDGSNWTYAPKRFWDQNADSYTFYAVSPAAIGNAATVNAETGAITSAAITFAGNNNDILVAKETTVEKAEYTGTTPLSAVAMHFNHIASLVDFKVKKHTDLGDATVTITSFAISNIDNVGTCTISSYDANKIPVATWAATARTSYDYSKDLDEATTSTYPTNIANTKADASKLISSLVVMPQDFRADENVQTATISYTITYADNSTNTFENVAIPIHKFDKVDDKQNVATFVGGWAQGKHYTFYITINDRAIEFTADITDWTEDEGYYYLVK